MKKYYEDISPDKMIDAFRNRYLTDTGWTLSIINKESIDSKGPVPWFTYPCIEFLKRLDMENWNVFEYGCGNSTLWWAKNVKFIKSVEHNKDYYKHVINRLPNNASLSFRPLDKIIESSDSKRIKRIASNSRAFLSENNFEKLYNSYLQNDDYLSYTAEILTISDKFDAIVIDGESRVLCSIIATSSLKKSGIIIFDNSDREEYEIAYEYLNNLGYYRIDFWGPGPINPYQWCTSIFICNLKSLQRKSP